MDKIRKRLSLTANSLKLIAITAMLIDHIAYRFLTNDIVLIYCMRLIGRMTAPIMCYFIAEGYFHTRNVKKYTMRMCIAALISHFPYVYFVKGDPLYGLFFNKQGEEFCTSVIFTLLLGLIALIIWNSSKLNEIIKYLLIAGICILAEYGDWGAIAVIWILLFGIQRSSHKKQMMSFLITGLYVWLLPVLSASNNHNRIFMTCNLGIYLVIPFLSLYSGKLGKSKGMKWLFYLFYPIHLLLLSLVYYKIIKT